MFVRVKTSKNSPKKAVQIVKAVRDGKKISQRIIRHVGTALDNEELVRLKELAEYIKATLETETQTSLFKPEDLAEMTIKARQKKQSSDEAINVNLKELREEQRIITGIHEIYGKVYKEIGFDKVFSNSKKKVSSTKNLFNIVMARIANPKSKRASVMNLERDFGVKLSLDGVYSMMDNIDDKVIDKIQDLAYQTAKSILNEKINVIFYDCTTLYFESFTEDDLKQNGYSKDMKFNQPQVVLALLATQEGFPIGYELFPGKTYEGDTLAIALENIEKKYSVDKVIFVADSGMFNAKNLDELEKAQRQYIVGARIRNMKETMKDKITDKSNYKPLNKIEKYATFDLEGDRKLIVTYSEKRAKKDYFDRQKNIEKIRKKLKKSKNPASMMKKSGTNKFLKVKCNSEIEIDETKIIDEIKWDGLLGIITNNKNMTETDIVNHYRGLWQIEECFRLSKHDLRIRPIFHWTPKRVKAHIAMCFMALTCLRNLTYRVSLQYKDLSPEIIRNELVHVQASILKHNSTNKKYCIPSKITDNIRKIYQTMGMKIDSVPYEIK